MDYELICVIHLTDFDAVWCLVSVALKSDEVSFMTLSLYLVKSGNFADDKLCKHPAC